MSQVIKREKNKLLTKNWNIINVLSLIGSIFCIGSTLFNKIETTKVYVDRVIEKIVEPKVEKKEEKLEEIRKRKIDLLNNDEKILIYTVTVLSLIGLIIHLSDKTELALKNQAQIIGILCSQIQQMNNRINTINNTMLAANNARMTDDETLAMIFNIMIIEEGNYINRLVGAIATELRRLNDHIVHLETIVFNRVAN